MCLNLADRAGGEGHAVEKSAGSKSPLRGIPSQVVALHLAGGIFVFSQAMPRYFKGSLSNFSNPYLAPWQFSHFFFVILRTQEMTPFSFPLFYSPMALAISIRLQPSSYLNYMHTQLDTASRSVRFQIRILVYAFCRENSLIFPLLVKRASGLQGALFIATLPFYFYFSFTFPGHDPRILR